MKIGSRLKKARETKRLSQQEVADQLSISQKTLSNIESDKSSPSVSQLARLGELYELDIIKLLSQQGITFQVQQRPKENDEANLGEIKGLFEQLLKEKDLRIALLEENLERLKKSDNPDRLQ